MTAFTLVALALTGLMIGSFLNVCIYRLPRRESIVFPASHCTSCQRPLAWYENVPLVSYLVLRRWATPLVAATCVLTAAMLEYAFGLALLFYSDPLFMLLGMLSLWLAMRVNEGADDAWNVGLLALLCAASVTVRWTGLIWTVVVCAALVSGDIRPSLNR